MENDETIGEKGKDSMEVHGKETHKPTMESNQEDALDAEPKINYRGWKAMPFIIGK